MAEGIMALPPGAAGEPMGAQEGPMGAAAPYAAAKNTLDQMDPETLSREAFSAAAEVDPQEVNAFLQEILAAGLTEEEIDQIEDIVEEVKAAGPEGYQEVREDLLAEGVDEELLPPEYDPEFFTALAMASYYLSSQMEEADLSDEGDMGGDMGGGIMAAGLPGPAMGGQEVPPPPDMSGPVMPEPQNFARGGIAELPSDMTSITEAIRSMGRGGDTILAHINPEEARLLKARGGSGTINPNTGLPEFIFKAIGRAFKSVGRAVKKFAKSTVGRVIIGVTIGTLLGPAAATGLFGAGASAAAVLGTSAAIGTFGSGILAGDGLKKSLISGLTVGAAAYGGATLLGGPSMAAPYSGPTTVQGAFQAPVETAKSLVGMGTPQQTTAQFMVPPPADATALAGASTSGTAQAALGAPTTTAVQSGAAGQTVATATGQAATASPGLLARAKTFLSSPSLDAFQNIFVNPAATTTLGKYGPAAALGYLALSGAGAFTAPSEEAPGIIPRETGEDIIAANPQDYPDIALSQPGLRGPTMVETPSQFGFPTIAQTEAPTYIPTGISAIPTAQGITQPYNREGLYGVPQMYRAAKGSGPQGVENFPRKDGHISGPGTGTSDDIPAMLSDGEFVFTAQAVRNMGGGSRRKGAARMYKMMKMLEGGPVGGSRSA